MAIVEGVTASDYIVIQRQDRAAFTQLVTSKLEEGYMLFGPPSFFYDGLNFQYIQAMILEAVTPEP